MLLCAIAVTAAGCGASSEKLSQSDADRALAALDSIQELIDEGRCKAAQRRVDLLIAQASNVNSDRQDLGTAYAKSAERLQQLVARECVEIKETSPTDEVTASTGSTGASETPEPTNTPDAPQTDPTNGGTVPDPPNPDAGNGGNAEPDGNTNEAPAESGGVRPQ